MGGKKVDMTKVDPVALEALLKLPRHLRTFNTFMPDTKDVPHKIAKNIFYNTSTGDSYAEPNDQVCFTELAEWKGKSLEYLHGPNAYQKYAFIEFSNLKYFYSD